PSGEGTAARPLAFGVDEYQMYLYELLPDARFVLFKANGGGVSRKIPVTGLEGTTLTTASRSLSGDFVGAGTADGRVALRQVRFVPQYQEQKLVDLELEVRDRGLFEIDPAKRPVRDLSYVEQDGRKIAAAIVDDAEIALLRVGE